MCIAEIIFKQKKLKERVTINLTYCGSSQLKCSLFQVEIFEHNSGRDKKKTLKSVCVDQSLSSYIFDKFKRNRMYCSDKDKYIKRTGSVPVTARPYKTTY